MLRTEWEDWQLADFEPFAKTARAIERKWRENHPGSSDLQFKWLVFSDSAKLRSLLQREWAPHAVRLDVGHPQHFNTGQSCDVQTLEWLLLTRCDYIVASASGFSATAAAFSTRVQEMTVFHSPERHTESHDFFRTVQGGGGFRREERWRNFPLAKFWRSSSILAPALRCAAPAMTAHVMPQCSAGL